MSSPDTKKDENKMPVTKSALELLEEDDEFEEFEGSSWEDLAGTGKSGGVQGEDAQLFQDDWEDDDTNDDFTQQLRVQIDATSSSSSSS
mmetsp:Transcript_10762/g.17556  ORF Transcript_10762/g.17556 Transcript_10762/m.17556 type:complete len:89 (+) Transcript_10762:109-375(+)|eukprot:CAMPEP_0174968536 /NCGR_PEP_ID=MMETSP0004_2-20121128/8188_1 /TAXON_ID=420556 /ORGANISM="Ochromonas sp., Strain CCMP1393" /LENGTH=88 /DNA_ID=CAMNT_0016217779 /DNA_START=76 /DNA_END=345 /DNA_ORIENTATION=+